ncbi:MAG: hypothetical protein ACFFKA_17720 [Candidatus Thorarchaeota archaeon]
MFRKKREQIKKQVTNAILKIAVKKNLRRKTTFGLLIVLLIYSAFFTGVSATPDIINGKIQSAPMRADVPIWEVGHSVTYNEQYINRAYSADGTITWLWYHNCTATYTVTDTRSDIYKIKMTSTNNEGSSLIGPFQVKFTPFTKISAEFLQRKTDLAYIRETYREKGLAFLLVGKLELPIPMQFRTEWGGDYKPISTILPFPLIEGTQDKMPNYAIDGHMKMSLFRGRFNAVDEDYLFQSGEQNYTIEMEKVTVPAGTFNTFNVSIESTYGLGNITTWSYYSPDIRWLAKQNIVMEDENGRPAWYYKCELISKSF